MNNFAIIFGFTSTLFTPSLLFTIVRNVHLRCIVRGLNFDCLVFWWNISHRRRCSASWRSCIQNRFTVMWRQISYWWRCSASRRRFTHNTHAFFTLHSEIWIIIILLGRLWFCRTNFPISSSFDWWLFLCNNLWSKHEFILLIFLRRLRHASWATCTTLFNWFSQWSSCILYHFEIIQSFLQRALGRTSLVLTF